MPTTKQIRVVTLLLECEKETGPMGAAVAERVYKIQGLNNCVVLSESPVSDPRDVQAMADAFERMAMRQDKENRFGKPAIACAKACRELCQRAQQGGCPDGICQKAFAK